MAIDDLAARPWLLLPGTLCTGAVFDGFLDALAVPHDNRETVGMDRPDVDAYAEICERSGPETVVCGFSLGAIIAAYWANRASAHRFVLFGINPHADDPAKMQARHDLAQEVATMGGAEAMRARLPALGGPEPDRLKTAILTMAQQAGEMIDAQTQLALGRPSTLPALACARAPVFALTGSNDAITPPELGRAAADAAPEGQFRMLDGLGHFALLEDPMACAAQLTQMEAQRHGTVRP